MRIQQLHVLLELCSGRTLLETAEKMKLTQPTVSFHLRKLEDALGLELVRKTSRKLRPTDEALELLPHVRRIVGLTTELEERAAALRVHGGGRLKLGASYTPATFLVPAYVSAFRERHPRVQLHLSVKKADLIIDMLRNYELDAALVALPDSPLPELVVRRLFTDELQLLVSPAHRFAAQPRVTAEELRDELLLMHEAGSTSRILTEEWLQQADVRFARFMELGAIETMKEAVKCNIGVAVLPALSVMREVAAGELVQHALPGYRNRRYISLVYRAGEQLSTNARLFTQFIDRHMEELHAAGRLPGEAPPR